MALTLSLETDWAASTSLLKVPVGDSLEQSNPALDVLLIMLTYVLGHGKCVEYMKSFNLPLLMLGGGGYTIRNVARCWTYETAVALDCSIPNELPYNDYFEYFGPDFKLHISPSNMTNQNTNEYLEKIKQRLFENLRMLPHAPGVQMQAIPEDAPHPDSGDEDEEDPDKRVSSKIFHLGFSALNGSQQSGCG